MTVKINDTYPEFKDTSLWNLKWARWIHEAIKDLKWFEGGLNNSVRLNKTKFEISRKRTNERIFINITNYIVKVWFIFLFNKPYENEIMSNIYVQPTSIYLFKLDN